MDNEMILKRKKLICFPAINQVYYINNQILDYPSLFIHIVTLLQDKLDDHIIKVLTERKENLTYAEFKELLATASSNLDIIPLISNHLNEFLKTVTYVDKKCLTLLLDLNCELILFNDNPYDLFLDELILTYNTSYKELFTFIIKDKIISTYAEKASLVIHDYRVEGLIPFHEEGCITVLLTPWSLSHKDVENGHYIKSVVDSNHKYHIDSCIDFTTSNFYQLAYYYNQILQGNAQCHEVIQKSNPIKVLLVLRTLRRKEEFRKQRFFISDHKVLYLTHIGGNVLHYTSRKCHTVLTKIVEVKDTQLYSNLIEGLVSICEKNSVSMINHIPSLRYFVEKDLMNDYLQKFCSSPEIKEMSRLNGVRIDFPQSSTLKANEVLHKDYFLKFIKDNKYSFPLILKYKGEDTFFKHLVTFIHDERSYFNYVEYFSNLNHPLHDVNIVVQTFINHSGYVLKMYRLAGESHLDYRSSLPDINLNFFDENFPLGFWNFKTIDLETDEYKKIWRKYHKENRLEIHLDEEKMRLLHDIVSLFENYSRFSLFGVDLLFSIESNSFYLIDCNSLPGYKIKNMDISQKFRKHFVRYCK